MTKVLNIAVGQKYTDKQNVEHTQWQNIGNMFVREDGKMSIKINCIPTNWNGYACVFEQKNDQNNGSGKSVAPF